MLEIIVSVADVIYQIALSLFFLAGSIMFFTVSAGFAFVALMIGKGAKDPIEEAMLDSPFEEKR